MRVLGAVLYLAAALCWAGEPGITAAEYASRRDALRQELSGGAAILTGEAEGGHGNIRAGFFQEANFYYLTGWTQPGAILFIGPEADVLFIPRRNPEQVKWTGPMADPSDGDIAAVTGFGDVRAREAFEAELPELVKGASKVYALLGSPGGEAIAKLLPLREIKDATGAIGKLRMKKSAAEVALIRRSAAITMEAQRAAWRRMAPGLHEYQIASTISGAYFDAGCGRHAFAPIVGSGPNGVYLHYSRNSRRFDAGELVLMDAGAECDGYAADITRTVPAGGAFTKRQREIYQAVLGAQEAAIAAVKPGMTLAKQGPNSLYRIAYDYIDSHGKDRHGAGLGKYFTHGLGHQVGLDVHDPGGPEVPLEAGMVITIEPGVYISEENIGIRIEDMVLVTEDGAEVLTAPLPKDVREIEQAVRKGG